MTEEWNHGELLGTCSVLADDFTPEVKKDINTSSGKTLQTVTE